MKPLPCIFFKKVLLSFVNSDKNNYLTYASLYKWINRPEFQLHSDFVSFEEHISTREGSQEALNKYEDEDFVGCIRGGRHDSTSSWFVDDGCTTLQSKTIVPPTYSLAEETEEKHWTGNDENEH